MATYYFTGNTNANWNVATNWSTISSGSGDGAIPTINDDVIFDANSPNCTIPLIAGSHPARSVDWTNYSRTMSFSDTIQTSGSITLGASTTYNIVVVGAGFQIIGGGTLTSNGKHWPSTIGLNGTNISLTLADDWVVSGSFNGQAGTTVDGFSMTVTGDLSTGGTGGRIAGTTNFIMTGTGGFGGLGTCLSNVTINTAGTITIGSVNSTDRLVLAGGMTLTYTAGTIQYFSSATFVQIAGNATLNIGGFPAIPSYRTGTGTNGITLLSDVNCIDASAAGTTTYTLSGGQLNIQRDLGVGTIGASVALNLANDLNVRNLSLGSGQVNGNLINVSGDLTHTTNNTISGTTPINLVGTGTWSHNGTGAIQNNLTINTGGDIDITGTVYYNTGTITYTKGIVRASNATFRIGTGTFINMHKIPFGTVTVTSGNTLTMNEFFNGLPSKRTIIQPSLTTNYTITFQDNFPRFARNVRISRATLSRPGQLTVITDKGNGGNNIGVKCYSNQMPNGIPINNTVFQQNATVFLAGGLQADPSFI